MRTTQAMSITLPLEMAEMVKAKVASGEYATESEVIRDGLRTLLARDAVVEDWLRGEVAKGFDEHFASPQSVVPAGTIMQRLKAAHQARRKTSSRS